MFSANTPLPVILSAEILAQLNAEIMRIENEDIRKRLTDFAAKKDYNLLLRNAVNLEQVALTQFLLAQMPGVNVNSCSASLKQTSLHLAIMKGNLALVKLLVESGAYVNAMDSLQQCPVVLAQINEKFDIMLYLLQQGGRCYFVSEDQNVAVSVAKRPAAEVATLRQIMQVSAECDREMQARPSIQKTYLVELLCSKQIATLRNFQATNQCKSRRYNNNDEIPLMQFLLKNNITILTRKKIFEIDRKFKDLPLDIMTLFVTTDLMNDDCYVLPLSMDTFQHAQDLARISAELPASMKLSVHENMAALHKPNIPLLRWTLSFDANTVKAEAISTLAKQMGACIVNGNQLTFMRVDAKVVEGISEFISGMKPTLKH